jgi:digeranylgeranylglycerophospholipid reductase
MIDVVVVGAGPAGCITAQRLAARGRRVVVVEEHAAVGAPVHCTGLIGREALNEFALPPRLVLGEAGRARFSGAAGQSVTAQGSGDRSDHIRALVIDRAALDLELADRACAAGAQFRLAWRAETITVGEAGVMVTSRDGGEVSARALVLACGASYRFHRQLGLGLPKTYLQSAQLEIPFAPEDHVDGVDDVEVRFGRAIAPGGFAWLVPLRRDGQPFVRLGLMAESRAADLFADLWRSVASRGGLGQTPPTAPRLKMLPLSPVARTYADRVLAVGDAAGLVKPTTGGGIYYGMLSGDLAAATLDAALRGNDLGRRALRAYEQAWRRRLGSEIRAGLVFRKIAARLSDKAIDDLIELARVNGILPLLQQHASFNWHGRAAIALLAHRSFRQIVAAARRGE